jgi:hypothetical protein
VLRITALPGLVCFAHHSEASLNEQGHHFAHFGLALAQELIKIAPSHKF